MKRYVGFTSVLFCLLCVSCGYDLVESVPNDSETEVDTGSETAGNDSGSGAETGTGPDTGTNEDGADTTRRDTASADTGTDTAAETDTGSGAECAVAADCMVLSDSCECGAYPVSAGVENCQPEYSRSVCEYYAYHLPMDHALCVNGECVLDVNCDASNVTCDDERLRCWANQVPVVTDDGSCWADACVAVSECRNEPLNNSDDDYVQIPTTQLVNQAPIRFTVRNTTNETVFVEEDHINPVISLSYTTGAVSEYEKYQLHMPFCTEECSSILLEEGQMSACVFCMMLSPHMGVLAPGIEYASDWSGESFTTDTFIDRCDCYNGYSGVLPGTVRAEVCIYREFTCTNSDTEEGCPLDGNTELNGEVVRIDAESVGEPECFQTTFDLPTTDTEIEILITAPEDTDTADTAQ